MEGREDTIGMKSEMVYRKEISNMVEYIPGKTNATKTSVQSDGLLVKLSSNENPLGPSPHAVMKMLSVIPNVERYPDPTASGLRKAIAQASSVSEGEIIVANGAEQVLNLIAYTLINPGDQIIQSEPTFEVFSAATTLMGGEVRTIPMDSFRYDFDKYMDRIGPATKAVYVCNPNNPTGNIATRAQLECLCESLPDNVFLVLDEAYREYAASNPHYPDGVSLLKKRKNVAIVRTFSKAFGLAGVRVGYAITSEEMVSAIKKVRPAFAVNALAQAAALGALTDDSHVGKTTIVNRESMNLMEEFFYARKLEYIPSFANFVMVNVGFNSREVCRRLEEHDVFVKPGEIWNMEKWIRISTGSIEQTLICLRALENVLGSLGLIQ